MYKKLAALREVLTTQGFPVKDVDQLATLMGTIQQVNAEKNCTRRITTPEYTTSVGGKTFIVPVRSGLKEIDLDNLCSYVGMGGFTVDSNILVYLGKEMTGSHLDQIASKLHLVPGCIEYPTFEEALEIIKDKAFVEALQRENVSYVVYFEPVYADGQIYRQISALSFDGHRLEPRKVHGGTDTAVVIAATTSYEISLF